MILLCGHAARGVFRSIYASCVLQIGEHTDYNDGFVMPCAIDRHMIAAITPTDGDEIVVAASDYDGAEDR